MKLVGVYPRMGYRNKYSLFQDLVDNCGLIAFNTPETDKVGKQSRPAEQALQALGDGVTYIDTGIVPNQNTALRIWGNFKNLTNQLIGTRDSSGVSQFFFGVFSSNFFLGYGTSQTIGITADTLSHKFEIFDGELFLDDVKISGNKGATIGNPSFDIWLQTLNNGGSVLFASNFNLEYAEIDHNGKTYTLDPTTRLSNGQYPLTTEVGNEPLYAQQFLSPATPTEVITTRESLADTIGYTIADGTQTQDAAGLLSIAVGDIIPNFLNSNISIGYLNGEHFIAQYSGRVKYDMVVCDVNGIPTGGTWESGAYITWADLYNGVFISDLNDITTNHLLGTNKALAYDDMVDNENNQQFASPDRQRIMWFEEPISGECEVKALKELGFNTGEFAVDTEGEFAIDSDGYYAKEGD